MKFSDLTPEEREAWRREARAQYGFCYWHPDTPQRAGVRGHGRGARTFTYCPICSGGSA